VAEYLHFKSHTIQIKYITGKFGTEMPIKQLVKWYQPHNLGFCGQNLKKLQEGKLVTFVN